MITEDKLNTIFSAMGTAISLTVIRSDQKLKKLPRIYVTYHVPFELVESSYLSERTVADPGNRNAAVSRWEDSRVTVTLKFYGDKNSDYATIRTKIQAAIQWIWETRITGVAMRVISPQVLDETTFIEQNYQYVMSFDMRLDLCQEQVNTVEAIERLEGDGEVDGVADAVKVIVTEP